MAISSAELLRESRYTLERNRRYYERTYRVNGTNNPRVAVQWGGAVGDFDAEGLFISRKTADTIPDDHSACILKITFSREPGNRQQPGGSSIEFDTSAQTENIKAMPEEYGSQEHWPVSYQEKVGQLIGVIPGDPVPQGADVYVPTYNLVESHWRDACPYAFRHGLYAFTGCINKYPWKEFGKREALFLGASGRQHDDERWQVTYRFAGQPSVVRTITLLDGSSVIVDKRGWDYVWFTNSGEWDAATSTLNYGIVAAHYARLYIEKDFSVLGIGV